MEEKELKAALVEHKADIQKIVDGIKEAEGKELKALQNTLDEAKKTRDIMQKQLDEIATEQKKAKLEPVNEVVTFAVDLRKQIHSEIDNIKGMTKDHKKEVMLSVKSFLETANASVTTGALVPWPQLDPGVSKAPDRMPFVLDIISRGISNSLNIYWTVRKTRTDNTEYVTEGGSPSESVLGYNTTSQAMVNLSSYLKVSNNSIDDIDWLMSEIQTELVTLHLLKIDAQILTGSAGSYSFDGIYTVATDFAAGGDTVQTGATANRYDVLMFAINQIKVAQFNPSYILVHPSDLRDMLLERDENGAYMIPQYGNVKPMVAGVPIIANTGMTAGTYLVGDFTKAKYWTRKDMELRIWEQNDTDAIAQLKTVTLYSRGTLVVKTTDRLAFVKDTFAASITEITNP